MNTARWKSLLTRPMVAVLAIAMAASFATFELARPAAAKAAAAAPAAEPLDDNSVAALAALDKAMETLAARVTPAIVNVTVTSKTKAERASMPEQFRRFFGPNMPGEMNPQPEIQRGLGSGAIISPDGYIVTNNHVVDGAVEIRVTTSDRRVLPAKLVGADPLTDLAVIKVDAMNLPSIPWGDSTQLHPGQTVLAFGNPMGMRFSVTRGIVSALNRANPYSDDARKPGQFIQTDAAINPGNSGGPLVNIHGEVVGINTFLISNSGSFSGMGFAIPTQVAKPTTAALIKDGKVSHGYMGIGISDVTPETAKFFHTKDNTGAVVSQVESGSPAEKAGLKVGDVITEVDGQKVNDAGQLQVEVGQKHAGTPVKLGVMRDGKSMDLSVKLEEMGSRDQDTTETASSEPGKPRWGVGLSDLTPEVREQLRVPENISGAVIEQVKPGSSADDAGLQRGDVIAEVNRKPVKSMSDVKDALASVPKGQDALVLVWSNGGSTFRVLHAPDGV